MAFAFILVLGMLVTGTLDAILDLDRILSGNQPIINLII